MGIKNACFSLSYILGNGNHLENNNWGPKFDHLNRLYRKTTNKFSKKKKKKNQPHILPSKIFKVLTLQ